MTCKLNHLFLCFLLSGFLAAASLASPIQAPLGNPSQDTQSTPTQRPLNRNIPLRILPLGNSITYGYGSTSGNGYRQPLLDLLETDVTYIGSEHSGNMTNNAHEGHPGAIIYTIALYADQSLILRPNIILLMAGTNDMIGNFGVEEAPGRLGVLIDRCVAACPDAVLLVAHLTPFLHQPSQRRADVFNAAIPGLISERVEKGMKVIEVDMMEYVKLEWLMDGLHPGDAGYDGMARGWYDGLKEASGKSWITRPVRTEGDEVEEL